MTYATLEEAKAYSDLLVELDDAEITKLLEKSERDVDSLLDGPPNPTTGLKRDPGTMTTAEAAALSRATSAQAEYRYAMGPDFFREPQYQSVSGPNFSRTGTADFIGPQVRRELASAASTTLVPNIASRFGMINLGPTRP
jgi:hypothetical protein